MTQRVAGGFWIFPHQANLEWTKLSLLFHVTREKTSSPNCDLWLKLDGLPPPGILLRSSSFQRVTNSAAIERSPISYPKMPVVLPNGVRWSISHHQCHRGAREQQAHE
ncbi:hypothetical protein PAAG_01263 [Paracoccidioides lutzii Pb01]|uniref:Uncharacterized protein n=1 Tax=Paracoccidioides lutzii (strain ATCC MYA-826 / Pb01) TaxID=502779 RepID=C1GRW8_PARBA|nr:hypothetical protein PAAG_01263 [Paracoccidioides lutzii Pb01]EEH38341.2 hypothetical protein PAAG_01263 [Paracoccidioides lutzii Pb01]